MLSPPFLNRFTLRIDESTELQAAHPQNEASKGALKGHGALYVLDNETICPDREL
jgi:hypothetical protein